MKVLVTGGAGFIGSHLCNRLIREGNDVWCQDNFLTGKVGRLIGPIEIINEDVRFGIPQESFDLIYNLACPASPKWYQSDPIKTLQTNFLGTLNVLRLAKNTGARVFQASTSEIYGDPLVSPQHEDYWGNVNPIGIRACYDEGKRVAETLCYDYHRQEGVDIRVGRIFNTYGPNMALNDGRVVSNFIIQALQGKPLTIYGDGSQTRSFCYVDDTVDGIIDLMESYEIRPVNIGNDKEYTMLQLATMILELTGSDSQIEMFPLPEDDPKQRRPDLTRIKDIGWQPTTKLIDGLMETIEYFRGIV